MANVVCDTRDGWQGWSIQYDGGRLADIYLWGSAVDCVQVRDWDWSRTVQDPVTVSDDTLRRVLQEYVDANAGALVAR